MPLEVGQVVTFLDVYGTCGRCWYCTVGHATTRCPARKVYGVTLPAEDGLLGGWAEYIHLKPGVHVIPLPDELGWRAFLSGGRGMPTALHAVTLGEIAFGDTVVVQGTGPVGLCAVALAQPRGRRVSDRGRGTGIRLDAATGFGADAVIDIATAAPGDGSGDDRGTRSRCHDRGDRGALGGTGGYATDSGRGPVRDRWPIHQHR